MNEVDVKLQEIIDFFELEGASWDSDSLMREYAYEIKELKNNALDEIGLEHDGKILMVLDDFVEEYFNRIIDGVCSVIRSFQGNSHYKQERRSYEKNNS